MDDISLIPKLFLDNTKKSQIICCAAGSNEFSVILLLNLGFVGKILWQILIFASYLFLSRILDLIIR